MNLKPNKLLLPLIAGVTLALAGFQTVAMANPSEHCEQRHMSPEKMHEHM